MKKLSLLVLAFLSVFCADAYAQSTIKFSAQNPAATLTGAEVVPAVQGGANVKTTTGAIAALAGSASTFSVLAYGAVCDGWIIPAGISTTSGSKNISLSVGPVPSANPYVTSFGNAAAGDIIVLNNPAQVNTGTSPSTFQTTTLTSVSGSSAVLASNATFTSSSAYGAAGSPGAAAHIYHTDNTTAVQAAVNAANATGLGGIISSPPGYCAVNGPITFYSNEIFVGSGPSNSGYFLTNGSNGDLFVGYGFAGWTGSANVSGVVNSGFQNINLDGNKASNTGSGQGTNIGTGDGIRYYGTQLLNFNYSITNFAGDGIYSEWNNGGGDALNTALSENSFPPTNGSFANNAGWAWVYNGPHDGVIDTLMTTNCGLGGIKQYGYNGLISGANGGPVTIHKWHSYQCSGTGYDLDAQSAITVDYSNLEGNTLLRFFDFRISNSSLGTLTIGTAASGTAYQLSMVNDVVTTVNNGTGSGYLDSWIGGSIGTLSGAAYAPWFVYGVQNGTTPGSPKFSGAVLSGMGNEAINMSRPCCTSLPNVTGKTLTIQAGAGSPLGTDLPGGNLALYSGISTGTGSSGINFNVYPAGSSGTADNSPNVAMTITGAGSVGVGTTVPLGSSKFDVRGAEAVNGIISNGTKFTTSSCSISATTGGASAGTFTLGANSCTAVVTINGATGLTAPTGWSCSAWDITTPTALIGGNTASSATTASFTIPGGAGATDVIGFLCVGY